MRQGFTWPRPATVLAALAAIAALTGSAYAAGRIDGHAVRAGSLPGNRLKPRSVGASRLRRGVFRGILREPVSGSQIDERSLGQVPSAAYADLAGAAATATEAQTAQEAIAAADAGTVNGHSAGCAKGTLPYAGACWQSSAGDTPVTAPVAAAACAAEGGSLPDALQLADFAQQPGVTLSAEEWTSDIPAVAGPGAYAVVVVRAEGTVNYSSSSSNHQYRCVIPLVV